MKTCSREKGYSTGSPNPWQLRRKCFAESERAQAALGRAASVALASDRHRAILICQIRTVLWAAGDEGNSRAVNSALKRLLPPPDSRKPNPTPAIPMPATLRPAPVMGSNGSRRPRASGRGGGIGGRPGGVGAVVGGPRRGVGVGCPWATTGRTMIASSPIPMSRSIRPFRFLTGRSTSAASANARDVSRSLGRSSLQPAMW